MPWLPLTDDAACRHLSDTCVDEQINQIQDYLQCHIDSVGSLLSAGHDSSHVEILVFATLDALGSLVFPGMEGKGGGTRLRMFVEQYCGCPELLNYSVPALLDAIDPVVCDQLHSLRSRCLGLFCDHWQPGCMPELSQDLCKDEVKELTGDLEVTIRENPRITLGQCQHSRMLAAKRNAIVHQLVRKGLRSAWQASSPHYIWCSDETGSNSPEKWDLVYPVPFLLELCKNGLATTCEYLREKEISPQSILIKSSPWLVNR